MREDFSDVELSQPERDELLMAVTDAFRTDEDTWPLLTRIGFPMQRSPTFTGHHRKAWHEVLRDLNNGIIHAPYKRLLAEALRERPGNSVFVRLAAAHGVASPPVLTPLGSGTRNERPSSPMNDRSARPTYTTAGISAGLDAQNVAFLCHSSGDKEKVRDLYHRLTTDGVKCWFDEEDILPGQDFELEIRKAIRGSRYVIVCLSAASVTKTGFVQRELRYAVDRAKEQPEGAVYLIAARLEPCEIPDSLARLNVADIFAPTGYERLLASLRSAGGCR